MLAGDQTDTVLHEPVGPGRDGTLSPQKEPRGPIRNEAVHLPEFGIDLNSAMCRNPICRFFGVPFEGEIPKGATQVTVAPYVFRLVDGALKNEVGEIECKYCGQTSRVLSNRGVRPIARYYLSLSMPFAACPDPTCANHGINLFENWASRTSRAPRYYRLPRTCGDRPVIELIARPKAVCCLRSQGRTAVALAIPARSPNPCR